MGYMKPRDLLGCIICIIMQIFKRQENLICKEEKNSIFVDDFEIADLSLVNIQKKKGCKSVFLIKRLQISISINCTVHSEKAKIRKFCQSPSTKSTPCSI